MNPSANPGTWNPVETRKYIWDGFNIAAEIIIDHVNPATNISYYTWGLDLSGSLQGAGGVGCLLCDTKVTSSETNTYYALGDANGNVTEYIDNTGAVAAHGEHSTFGETKLFGSMKNHFTHWFSTKPFDKETEFVVYQWRYYAPVLCRWLSRDPIEERGGNNLSLMCENDTINKYDPIGQMPATTWTSTGFGQYYQLATALIDFLNGGPTVTYNYEYPDSVTQKLLEHPDVADVWKEFKKASCTKHGFKYPKSLKISHTANTIDFVVDLATLWGINTKYRDFGIRILGSFSGNATIKVDCKTCKKELSMTLQDSFTVESLTRIPYFRKPLITYPFLNPVKMYFNYDITEDIQ